MRITALLRAPSSMRMVFGLLPGWV